MATGSSILAWKIPVSRGAWRDTVHGVSKSHTHTVEQGGPLLPTRKPGMTEAEIGFRCPKP